MSLSGQREEIPPGTLEMLILRTLARGRQMHGFEIADFIQETSSGVLQVEEGSLYPCLYRMEEKGWIAAEWGKSENNRRAKYYSLTRAGRKQLAKEEREWQQATDILARFLTEPGRTS